MPKWVSQRRGGEQPLVTLDSRGWRRKNGSDDKEGGGGRRQKEEGWFGRKEGDTAVSRARDEF